MNPLPDDQSTIVPPLDIAGEEIGETVESDDLRVQPEIPLVAVAHPPTPNSSQYAHIPLPLNALTAYYRSLGAIGKTIYEALLLAMAALWMSVLLTLLHLSPLMASKANVQGLADFEKLSPFLLIAITAVLAPCIEEPLFRGLPYLLLRMVGCTRDREELRAQWLYWPIGGLAALVFAILHGAGDHSLHVPLPQLMLGLWSWHVTNTRGLRYSILLHGTYNFIPTCLMVLAHR